MKNIVLLGSTGSVGRNVLRVVREYPEKFRVTALSSNRNIALLSEQTAEFKPDTVVVGDEGLCSEFKKNIMHPAKVLSGPGGLLETAVSGDADIVFMAISGTVALMPLVAALRKGRTIALASKEPIVSAGEIVMRVARENSGHILPVDSEHSAIFQCLNGKDAKDVEKLYITGSGGPLWSRDESEFDGLSISEVLSHPRWEMGRKITVDSATLMNKGLEVIEARWLFDIAPDKIKVIIHPEAVVHSMVEFIDGTIQAGLFCPDMRFPILRALSYPEVLRNDLPRVDFPKIRNFTFFEPGISRSRAIDMAFAALRAGGTMPAVLNAANEAAVELFLGEKLRFNGIMEKVEQIVKKHSVRPDPSLDDIIDAEKWAKEEVLSVC